MSRDRAQRAGSFKRVPSYCFPARRKFPIRWFLSLAVAIAWLLVLEGQESLLQLEPHRALPSVVETFDVSLVPPELDGSGSYAAYEAERAAEIHAVAAASPAAGLDEAALAEAQSGGHPDGALRAAPAQGPAPVRGGGAGPVAALPAGGPRSPSPAPSGDGPDPDAIARPARLASIAAGLQHRRAYARNTSPVCYDCLRLCGRGPPAAGALS